MTSKFLRFFTNNFLCFLSLSFSQSFFYILLAKNMFITMKLQGLKHAVLIRFVKELIDDKCALKGNESYHCVNT